MESSFIINTSPLSSSRSVVPQENTPAFGCLKPPCKSNNSSLTPQAMLYSPELLWTPGQTLKVYFMGIDPNDKRIPLVLSIAKIWEQYAFIKFEQTANPQESDIRVAFEIGQGSWSYVGRECQGIPKQKPTMNFGWFYTETNPAIEEYHRTAIHEFGHALGFHHEQQNPFDSIPWDEEKVYQRYSG